MSRYQLIRGLLIAGVFVGFAHGFMSLRHHREWHRHCDQERTPPAATSPR